MTWSLPGRAVRKHCQSVLYTIQPRLAQMTCLKLSPISIFYTVYKLFLTVKVTFHLYNSHFHLRFADIGVPTELLSVRVSTLKKTSTVTSEDAYQHPFFDCDCERRAFVCTPCGCRKVRFTPHYPALELWPAEYSLLIMTFCCHGGGGVVWL